MSSVHHVTYPFGKELAWLIDGDGKVLRLLLQLEAHNQVLTLFLGGTYCMDSL